MADGDEYKEIIQQCIGSVKEVFGEGKFDDIVASIMKMQEKVLASSMQQQDGAAGQIAVSDGAALNERIMHDVREEFKEELKVIKKRILRLERAVFGNTAAAGAPKDNG